MAHPDLQNASPARSPRACCGSALREHKDERFSGQRSIAIEESQSNIKSSPCSPRSPRFVAPKEMPTTRSSPPARGRRLERMGGKSRHGSGDAAPASTRKRRALLAGNHFIDHAAKQWRWDRLSAVGFKDLNGLKQGESPTRGQNFRKAAAPWTSRRVRQPIACLVSENRVRAIAVAPAIPSRVGRGRSAQPLGSGVSMDRLRSHGRCRCHRRSKHLDQDHAASGAKNASQTRQDERARMTPR